MFVWIPMWHYKGGGSTTSRSPQFTPHSHCSVLVHAASCCHADAVCEASSNTVHFCFYWWKLYQLWEKSNYQHQRWRSRIFRGHHQPPFSQAILLSKENYIEEVTLWTLWPHLHSATTHSATTSRIKLLHSMGGTAFWANRAQDWVRARAGGSTDA